MKINEILKITGGKLVSGDRQTDIDLSTISTDSRAIKAGQFFLPLKGNNFNGEDFIAEAFSKGAIGSFTTQHPIPNTQHPKIIIRVKNTTEALQKIAHAHRMKFDIPVIGVTGSNGKTTVKEMISGILLAKFKVLKNEGTKNNHIGVPQTLLKLKKGHDICVLEMGTNHKGEIRTLADIARPDTAVITNIGPSHLEFLKCLKGVYESKKEIFSFFERRGKAVINGDDEYLSTVKGAQYDVIRFGFGSGNDFRASHVKIESNSINFLLNDKYPFTLKLLGAHNVYNALAAIAVARNFGLSYESIRKTILEYRPVGMRLSIKNIGGIAVINDAYNSNPLSMKCALETVRLYPAKARWIVSADMLELGKKDRSFHAVTGETIAKYGFDGLLTFGKLSQLTSLSAVKCGMDKERVWHCSTREEIADILRKVSGEGDVVLVKGSRAMKMEEVIEFLRK